MKHNITTLSLLLLTFLLHNNSFGQWINIGSLPSQYYKILSIPNTTDCYAIIQDSGISEYHLKKSTNGGLTFTEVNPGFSLFDNADIQQIEFLDGQTGYMGFRANNPTLTAYVYKTIDSGKTWTDVTPINYPLGFGEMQVHFINEDTGFVASENKMYRTTDGGDSWKSHAFPVHGGPTHIKFYDSQRGIVGAWDGTFIYQGRIYITDDGGDTWDSLYINQTQTAIGAVDYISNNIAFALLGDSFNSKQILLKTTNSGKTWDTIPIILPDTTDHAFGFKFIDTSLGYMHSSQKNIYKTTDGGKSWQIDYTSQYPGITTMDYNGKALYFGGPLNTLITNDLSIGIENKGVKSSGYVFPNPVGDERILNFDKALTGEVQIITIKGEVAGEMQLNNQKSIDLTPLQLKPGTYFLNMINESGQVYQVVVK